MAQGILPFQYEQEKNGTGMTSMAGLPAYLDLSQAIGLWRSIKKNLQGRNESQGWTDTQVVMSFILLNLAGGDCVDDLDVVNNDEGFCRLLRRIENHGLSRKKRREQERRWRKERKRSVPSPSSGFRYLSLFHDSEQEKLRPAGKAFIPAPNLHLQGFPKINRDMIGFVQPRCPQKTATLDMDATLVETFKKESHRCYKGFKSYQPLNTWWAEQEMVLHTEFRDGNVPAGYQQLRVFREALELLPAGVEKVRLRSDTAGYQHDLLRYCSMGQNKRFGKIEFAVGCDVTPEFKKAVAELEYKVFGMVTNMDWDGEELIHWQRKRCGKSEEVHSVMKDDMAGGKFPSGDFGENAAWWWIMILALNLNQAMKRLVLGVSWISKRLKAIRFSLINLPGRVIEDSRRLIVRLSKNHPSFDWLLEIRTRIASLVPVPSG